MKVQASFRTYLTACPAPKPYWRCFEQMRPVDSHGYSVIQLSVAPRTDTHIDAPSRPVKGRQAIELVSLDTAVGVFEKARTEVGDEASDRILAILED